MAGAEQGRLPFCRLLIGLALAGPAAGQGVPVVDSSAISAAQQNLAALQQQLQQLQNLVQTAQSLAKSIGQVGPLAVVLPTSLTQAGLAQFSRQVTAEIGAGPEIASFAGARQWVGKTLLNSGTDSASQRSQGRLARSQMAGEAAADGYALALTARQQAAAMADRANQLAAQVGAAATLRDDIAANSAVMLAIHDEMSEIQALLAANLALQSGEQLLQGDGTPGTPPVAAPADPGP